MPQNEDDAPYQPSLPFRVGSTFIMLTTGLLSRSFLYGLSFPQTYGLERFTRILDEREDIEGRRKGLITVSNHVSVLDDPMIWGVLPIKYMLDPHNLRWGLASHDLCFQNKFTSTFFTLGQLLPAHRAAHSPHGGLFQPTMTQAIRLLSRGPFTTPSPAIPEGHKPSHSPTTPDLSDPFTSNVLTYTTNGSDTYPSPSSYWTRRHAWIHIFPEGKIHQSPSRSMRYFKWGISRLILESDPAPDVVPIWIDGMQEVMHESRQFPRFLPRPWKEVSVTFGDLLDGEEAFGDLRQRWRDLKQRKLRDQDGRHVHLDLGELSEELKYCDEAEELRIECSMRVRQEVLKVRKRRGWRDEDPKCGWVDTWKRDIGIWEDVDDGHGDGGKGKGKDDGVRTEKE